MISFGCVLGWRVCFGTYMDHKMEIIIGDRLGVVGRLRHGSIGRGQGRDCPRRCRQ